MKRNRRGFALLTALALAFAIAGGAWAEDAKTQEKRYTSEQASELVEALFVAAAGTDLETEQTFRKEKSAEEYAEHRSELAEHRRQMLPWLVKAFEPEIESEAESEPEIEAESESTQEKAWEIGDGYAALEDTQTGRRYIELLRGYGYDGAQACVEGTQEACRQWMEEINAAALRELNPDYACWLYSAGTQIDYPVVQCDDNAYYLKRMFNGKYNSAGTLFIDYRNLPAFQDPNTLIYGHHMRNGSMFKSITYYEDQEWYESHPFMLMIAESEIAIIELVAGYRTTSKDHCYDIAISDDVDLMNFAKEAKEKSDFETETEIQSGDRLVTLSTCAYEYDGARCIAIGRLESVWRDEEGLERIMTEYEQRQLANAQANKR